MYTDLVAGELRYTDDPLGVYVRLVQTVPRLQDGEAEELFRRVEAGDEAAKRRLIEANLHLVLPIVERHRASGIHRLELIEKGNDGLIRAVETFADAPADAFPAYANNCIEQAVSTAAAAGPIARSFPHLRDS